jgi:hypothetical protein
VAPPLAVQVDQQSSGGVGYPQTEAMAEGDAVAAHAPEVGVEDGPAHSGLL